MIRGIGIDIIEIERIERALARHPERMKKRLYTEAEREYCEARANPMLHYAARFAAKEAFSKAVGTGMAKGFGWQDAAILNHPGGEPYVLLSDRGREILTARGATRAHVSLSHSNTVACAVIVIED